MAGYTVSNVTSGRYTRQVSVAASGPQGAQGPAGAKGDAGLAGGLSAVYKFSNTHTAADPGTGYFAFNSASIFSTTSLFISERDALTDPQVGLLDAAITSTNSYKAVLTVQDAVNTRKFSRYYVLEQSQSTGWRDLSIAYLDGTAQSWTYNDRIVIMVTPIGDVGPTGATGAPGAPGVGVPAGGRDGQVLKKVGTSDYETEWVDPSIDASAVSNLVDVNLSGELLSTTTDQVLVFDHATERWINKSTLDIQVSIDSVSGTIVGGSATTF